MKIPKPGFILSALTVFIVFAFFACEDQQFEPATPGLLVPKTVDEDPSLPHISLNGTTFHAETYGDPIDPMLIILHGGPGGDYRSMLNCKQFADEGYFVVFYDQRGSGLSQRHRKNTYTMDLMVDDLGAVIQHYRTAPDQKVFLLGHSWGAMLATAYIDKNPSVIAGAALAEPGGLTWEDTRDYISRTRKSSPLGEDVSDVFYHDQFLTGKRNEHEILDYKFALTTAHDNARGNAIGNTGPTPFWRYGAALNARFMELGERDGFDFTRNLDQYTNKVLFLYSELNTAYGLNHADRVSSAYPNVQLMEIEDTGHEMIYFGWEKFYPIALQYLQ